MKHRELWLFGILALVTAMLFLRAIYTMPEEVILVQPPVQELPVQEVPVYEPPVYEAPVKELPVEPAIEQPMKIGPTREELLPGYIEFAVNRIIVPPLGAYPFLPIRIDRPRTFDGKFGPYSKDPTDELEVVLCSYAYKYENQVLACDRPRLSFIDNYVVWGLGYAEDEYIGGQAIRDFGAAYTIKSKTHGELARSNEAIINLVN